MKKIFALLCIFWLSTTVAQVRWMSINEALEAQKAVPKKIIIDFYATWCAPCREMDFKTYAHPAISSFINEHYYAVKFNVQSTENISIFGRAFGNASANPSARSSTHDFAKFMNVSAVPSIAFIDEQAMPITLISGALSARELEPYLSIIADNGYEKINSKQEWDAFQKKFKSAIKD